MGEHWPKLLEARDPSQRLRKAVCVEGGNGRTIQNGARRLRRIAKGEQNLGPERNSREKMERELEDRASGPSRCCRFSWRNVVTAKLMPARREGRNKLYLPFYPLANLLAHSPGWTGSQSQGKLTCAFYVGQLLGHKARVERMDRNLLFYPPQCLFLNFFSDCINPSALIRILKITL